MKTYKFKLYQNRKNRCLKRIINASASIYNHCIALHKRYYSRFKKHLNKYRLMKHIAKLRKRISYWQQVGSQSAQDICDRIDKAYKLFFKFFSKGTRPPSFCKVKKYKSFTLKQAGYKLLGSNLIKIGKHRYKFHKSREIEGKIKTVTVKRSATGDMYIYIVTDTVTENIGVATGKIGGFDFGLKCFLTDSMGNEYHAPLLMRKATKLVKALSKKLSSKRNGSNNWNKARIALAKLHERIVNKRRDFFWKLAHQLCDTYDYLFFENLNLNGIKRLWGHKVSDLAMRTFLEILQCVANKKGKYVGMVSRWYPSSKTCNQCGHIHKNLKLEDRRWRCPNCHREQDRDTGAAINICREGASSLNLDGVSQGLASATVV